MAIIEPIFSYEKRDSIIRRDEMAKLFLYLLKNEPNGKVLDSNEIRKLKIIFFGVDKNIIATGLSELIGWEDMLNNDDDDNENINIEKILPNYDILKDDYSFEEEEDRDEAIHGDKDSENSEENSNYDDNLILNSLSEEKNNNIICNVFLKYQTLLRDIS